MPSSTTTNKLPTIITLTTSTVGTKTSTTNISTSTATQVSEISKYKCEYVQNYLSISSCLGFLKNNVCTNGDGLYPNLSDGCKSFYQCAFTGTINQQITKISCTNGLLFDISSKTCNWASAVTCG